MGCSSRWTRPCSEKVVTGNIIAHREIAGTPLVKAVVFRPFEEVPCYRHPWIPGPAFVIRTLHPLRPPFFLNGMFAIGYTCSLPFLYWKLFYGAMSPWMQHDQILPWQTEPKEHTAQEHDKRQKTTQKQYQDLPKLRQMANHNLPREEAIAPPRTQQITEKRRGTQHNEVNQEAAVQTLPANWVLAWTISVMIGETPNRTGRREKKANCSKSRRTWN